MSRRKHLGNDDAAATDDDTYAAVITILKTGRLKEKRSKWLVKVELTVANQIFTCKQHPTNHARKDRGEEGKDFQVRSQYGTTLYMVHVFGCKGSLNQHL